MNAEASVDGIEVGYPGSVSGSDVLKRLWAYASTLSSASFEENEAFEEALGDDAGLQGIADHILESCAA